MEKIRVEQKNVTRFWDFLLFLFFQYNFVVGLLQGLMINAHESGSNSPGLGTFSRDLTKTKSNSGKFSQSQGFYLGFAYGKVNIPAISKFVC